jgi:glycosyltransferase involved in cell wall biosynthesis
MKEYPKISIVTPSFNQGQFIEETILSVLNQNYPNLEYIIIDGGSTDNTIEIIKKYEDQLSYWVSEKDRGQAHAINKGLEHCTGEIFNWLNSDDYLEQGGLHKIAYTFEDVKIQLVAGSVRTFSISNVEIIPNQQLTAKGLMTWAPGVKFVQPGVWMRRELITLCGGIDEQYHYAFDWDFYIRYLYFFSEVKELSDVFVNFRLHDDSKTESMSERFTLEERKIIEKINSLPKFYNLHTICEYKIQLTKWTDFLSDVSKTDVSFLKKTIKTLIKMSTFPRVSYSIQTLGAIKAFWERRTI